MPKKVAVAPAVWIPLTLPTHAMAQLPVSWDIIDHATDIYAKTLHEYNLGELVKVLLKHTGKTASYAVLPTPGNIDLKDPHLGFQGFLDALEQTPKGDFATAVAPIQTYLLSGKHPRATKAFPGWKRTLSGKKPMVAGTLSIDLPGCSDTQHYIAFVYLKPRHQLVVFDSASKNPIQDKNEIYYILHETFGRPDMTCVPFAHILQPGAGDKKSEDPRSYNNQNVFCHTWTLWFLTMFFTHFNLNDPDGSLQTLARLAHPREDQNLAMIKHFAMNLLPYIYDPPSPDAVAKKFPVRAYERAVMKNDEARLAGILENYLLASEPMTGLGYIYDASHHTVRPIQAVL